MRERGEIVCERIENGENCAIVTDAGMPAVSDPGEKLVMQCAERGIEVSVVPGPTAMASALAISGLPTGRFTFEGFLSMNKKVVTSICFHCVMSIELWYSMKLHTSLVQL